MAVRAGPLISLFAWAAALALLAACAGPAPVSPTPETPLDAFALNQRMGRGVNFGNALEAPHEGDWGLTLREEYFQLIAGADFTTIRIPIRWNAHAETTPPYTVAPEFFDRIDWAVNQALSRGLVAVINLHHYDEMAVEPRAHAERFLALWQQIAEHYRAYPNTLAFELLNEPNGQLGARMWNQLIAAALPVIRATNPARNIVIGPADWNSFRALPDLELPAADPHLIATFHFYEPFEFTHQGAEWVEGSAAWLGADWAGTSPQKQTLEFHLDTVAQWAEDNHRPVFLGEFGAYSTAGIEARARWTEFVARQAEARGFSWAYWEFGAGFGVYDPEAGVWNEPLLHALLPPQ